MNPYTPFIIIIDAWLRVLLQTKQAEILIFCPPHKKPEKSSQKIAKEQL